MRTGRRAHAHQKRVVSFMQEPEWSDPRSKSQICEIESAGILAEWWCGARREQEYEIIATSRRCGPGKYCNVKNLARHARLAARPQGWLRSQLGNNTK